MAGVRKRHVDLLRPYLIGEQPREGRNGQEWDMYCPLHDDTNRSAQLNIDTGQWYCHACEMGGSVTRLIREKDDWVTPTYRPGSNGNGNGNGSGKKPSEVVTDAKIAGWASALQSNENALEHFQSVRGLDDDVIAAYEIGWDADKKAYTIPIRGPEDEIWNVRRYQIDPPEGRRKIWSVNGMGSPRLYPHNLLLEDNPAEIIICEGEWDTLLTIQHGFAAITRTASASTWMSEWSELLKGKKVYLCHDADKTGQSANKKVASALKNLCDVFIINLPFKIREKHGKDLSDYWNEGNTTEDFQKLLESAELADPTEAALELDPSDATVLDSFDSRKVGQPLKLTVTIKGKRDPGYSVPQRASLSCSRDAGAKCKVCPLNAAGGEGNVEIRESDPVILEMIESTKAQLEDILRKSYGAVKCNRLTIDVKKHQAIETLYARPSVDHANGSGAQAYKNVKLTSVGRHDTMPNNTVQVVGSLFPDPRKQLNEFLAWSIEPIATSLDTFEMTPAIMKNLKKFQVKPRQSPLQKLRLISKDLEQHVTKIYGRLEMHMAMDLVFHSLISFPFMGQIEERGWLDLLVIGDTRTGKSAAGQKIAKHYKAGEVVSCESASFAGIVGGLQQYGSGKEWAVNWGAIPINDRRLVLLDEVSGLTHEEIGAMSDVRSRGIAQMTKIQQEATHARTRLIWMGNPRDGSMSDYTYGCQGLKPLIGNPEDIARFDMAMSAQAGEVGSDEINKHHVPGTQRYKSDACGQLVRWAWSRTNDHVTWARGSEEAIRSAAVDLGSRYVETIPLIQAANVRVKVARIAVALAARLFSTDEEGEKVIVTKEHVVDAVAFLDMIYGMRGFGYQELSSELIADRQEGQGKRKEIRKWLLGHPGMSKFLRGNSSFRRQDLEEVMNITREEANGIINTLWEARMIRKNRGDLQVEPVLHTILREVKN